MPKSNCIYRRLMLACAVFLFCLTLAHPSAAQSTEVTYQGQLQNSSSPANGSFDFEFVLYDGAGAQVGALLSRNGVTVSNGIFSVKLDFGSSFTGATRLLEIHVRPSGAGAFTTLLPRQPITSSPYSIKTLSADVATNAQQLGGVPANQYLQTNGSGAALTNLNATSISTGTVDNARLGQLPTANIADNAVTAPKIATGQVVKGITGGGSTLTDNVTLAQGSNISITPSGGNTLTISATAGNAILNQTTQQPSSNFNISGNGSIGGTMSAQSVNTDTQYNISGLGRVLSVGRIGANNIFLAEDAGLSNTSSTSGFHNSFVGGNSGRNTTEGFRNSFFGAAAGAFNVGGSDNTLVGAFAGVGSAGLTNATAIGACAEVNQSNSLVLGSITGCNRNTFTNVGIGTTTPQSRFHVVGSSWFQGDNTPLPAAAGTGIVVGSGGTSGYISAFDYSVFQPRTLALNGNGGDVTIGSGTANSGRLNVAAGPVWTINQWKNPVLLSNGAAIGWAANSGGSSYGIGHTNGSMAFFRTLSSPGSQSSGAIYNMVITDNDLVGIGTLAPDSTLTVNGGASKASGGTTWTVFSDERLKDIKGRFTPGLHALMKLQPIRYQYKPENALGLKGGGDAVGFSAQAVAKVLPEAVSPSTNGYLQLNSDPILWTMLNAIKEQQGQIEGQKKVIDAQNKQFAKMAVRLARLEKMVRHTTKRR